MAYIGNIPAEKFTSVDIQNFTVSATANYTLDRPVANENEIELFINNVRQHPGSGKAYTASGTALTLSEATAGTDTMYCVYQGKARQTVTPATSSVTNAMLAGSIDLTSKVTGALPQANIADQAINEAKMQISNAPTNGYMLTAQSGNTGGLTWAEAPSGSFVHLATIDSSNHNADTIQFQQVFSTEYKRYKLMGKFQGTGAGANIEFSWLKSDNSNHNVGNYHTVAMGYKINSSDYNQEGFQDWGQSYSRLMIDTATGSHIHSFSMDLFPNGYDNVNYPQFYAQINAWLHNSAANKMLVGQVGSYLENTTSLAGGGIRIGATSGNFGTVNFGLWGYKDS